MKNEKGQALPMVLLVLAVGVLITTPFLGQAGNSLISSRLYRQALCEQYAADAGIEYGIWHVSKDGLIVPEGSSTELPEFTLTNTTVNVTVENLDGQIHKFTSTATSEDGGSTTIEARARIPVPTGYTPYPDGYVFEHDTVNDNIYVEGKLTIHDENTINGSIYVEGTLTIHDRNVITGDIYVNGILSIHKHNVNDGSIHVTGDLDIEEDSSITGTVCVGGSLIANKKNNTITGNVCTGGSLILKDKSFVDGAACVQGNLELGHGCGVTGDAYVGGTIKGPGKVGGTIYPYSGCEPCSACETEITILSWQTLTQ